MPAGWLADVTCVIPTHGRDEYLRLALQSVDAQTVLPQMVVVVDDLCSRDTAALVTQYAREASFHVLYLAHARGQGAASSRNRGASVAKGHVLAFLDDDDVWEENYLESALDSLESSNAAAVLTWFDTIDESGDRLPGVKAIADGLSPSDFLISNPGVIGSNLAIRAEVFADLGGFDEHLAVSEDKDLIIRLLDSGRTYATVQSVLVHHRMHPGVQLGTSSAVKRLGLRRFHEKHGGRMTPSMRRRYLGKIHAMDLLSSSCSGKAWAAIRLMAAGQFGRLSKTMRKKRQGR